MAAVMVYMTAASVDEARRIARALVDERMAACANLIGGMRSVYRWNGEVQEHDEVVMVAKTRADLLHSLTDRVRSLHSYECPCVVGVPVVGGNQAFLDWINSETQADAG